MAAVIGLAADEVTEVLRQSGVTTLDVANENSPLQTVVSGLEQDVRSAGKLFADMPGCTYIPLMVSGAFHSRYMQAARDEFEAFMQQFVFAAPKIPVISNVQARPYVPDQIQAMLSLQLTHPVKWTETIQVMLGAGINEFREVGPGEVLSKLIRVIREQAPAIAIDWPI